METPQTGGSFVRDPQTGKLTRVVDPAQEPKPKAVEPAAAPVAEAPSAKKGK